VLLPEKESIFSWTNPMSKEHQITVKYYGYDNGQSPMVDYQSTRIDLEPDNLELNMKIELPPHL
jgi:hypothetical protein